MKKHSSDTIILNGQHFNAKTGLALTTASPAKPVKNVDGILPKHVTGAVLQKPAQYDRIMKPVISKPVMDVTRTPASEIPKRTLEPGKTLMRRALAKPSPSFKRQTKAVAPNKTQAAVSIAHVVPKISAVIIDHKKLQNAKNIPKSQAVSRFAAISHVTTTNALSTAASRAIVASQQAVSGLAKQPSLDIFERALIQAQGHEEKLPVHVNKSLKQARKSQRRLNFAASALAVAVLAGFIGYQQLPSMQFQYASSQAGFHAALPGYRPAGFSLGKLSYQAGAVSVNFHSNSDDRSFALDQKPSGWDSQALRDNFVAISGRTYHTAEAGGRTIYLYGNNNATWVNGGVWYTVQAGSSLTENQVTALAASI